MPVSICLGSAPRLRGRDHLSSRIVTAYGISPAPAGKRSCGYALRSCRTDQPRACGEEDFMVAGCSRVGGSAPRLRGREFDTWAAHLPDRISPAPAGKSQVHGIQWDILRDQPRACGEEVNLVGPANVLRGSAPRLRGRVRAIGRYHVRHWISPAPAGKSTQPGPNCLHVQDQPRACGEEPRTNVSGIDLRGSAPRLRGRARAPRPRPGPGRISPAPAGKRDLRCR